MNHFDGWIGFGQHRIHYCFPYHKTKILNAAGEYVKNPAFQNDQVSKYLLDLKNNQNRNFSRAVNFCGQHLLTQILPILPPQESASLCTVPSSKQGAWSPGVTAIIQRLAKSSPKLLNKSQLIRRTQAIEKLADGGNRNIHVHRESLSIPIEGRLQGTFILLDDITTTGNSMLACAELLYQHGAGRVIAISIGRTV